MPSLLDPPTSGWPSLLILARHGQSRYNELQCDGPFIPDDVPKEEIYRYNDLTVPLTPKGEQQRLVLGRNLRARYDRFDVLCHSQAKRSIDTALGAASILDNPDRPMERYQSFLFNERNSGIAFGMTKEEALDAFPWLPAYWGSIGWFRGIPPGGESIESLSAGRAWQGLEFIRERFPGKRVLLVGHGTWILSLIIRLGLTSSDVPERPPGLGNCGYYALKFDKDGTAYFDHTMRNKDNASEECHQ